MTYEVRLHPAVAAVFSSLDSDLKERLKRALLELARDPFRPRPKADIKKLRGTRGRQDLFRLRVGTWRVVYAVESNVIYVTDMFERGRGY